MRHHVARRLARVRTVLSNGTLLAFLLTDKSAVNLRRDCNVDNATVFDDPNFKLTTIVKLLIHTGCIISY